MDSKESKKTVRTFALASFLNDLGSDMIYPIWPLFVTSVLGANMAVLGLIDGLSEAVVSLSQALSGYLSDKIRKRKIFVWLGYLLAVFSRVGYAFSSAWRHLIPFRILDRAGKIRDAPRDAIVADVSDRSNRGSNFGILRAMDHLGAVVGILVCILFFERLGYQNLFLLAAIPSGIAVLLVYFAIKETKPDGALLYKGLSFRDLDINFIIFLSLSALFALGSFTYSFLLVFAKESGLPAVLIPVLYLIFTIVATVVSLPFGQLTDRIGRKKVLMISYILWGSACLTFIYIPTLAGIVSAFVLYGLHKGALDPAQKTLVAELAPKDYRASTLGGYQMVMGLCALPASFVAGILWDKISFTAPFWLSLGLTLAALVLLVFVREGK